MKNLNEMRAEIRNEWQRSVYDGYYGPAPIRERAWDRLLERIEAYATECIQQTAKVCGPINQQPNNNAPAPIDVTSAPQDDTSTIGVSTPSHPAKPATAARRTQSRRSAR